MSPSTYKEKNEALRSLQKRQVPLVAWQGCRSAVETVKEPPLRLPIALLLMILALAALPVVESGLTGAEAAYDPFGCVLEGRCS